MTDVYADFQISEDQTAIAIRTLTDGYKTVQSHMQQLKKGNNKYEKRHKPSGKVETK